MSSRSRIRSSLPADATKQESVSNLSLSKLLDDDDEDERAAPTASSRQRSINGSRPNQSSYRPSSRKSLAEMEEDENNEDEEEDAEEEAEDQESEDVESNEDAGTTAVPSRRSKQSEDTPTSGRSSRRSQPSEQIVSSGRSSRRSQLSDASVPSGSRPSSEDILPSGRSSRRSPPGDEDILGGPMSSGRSRRTTNFGGVGDRKSLSNADSVSDRKSLSNNESIGDRKSLSNADSVSDRKSLSNNESIGDRKSLSNNESIGDRKSLSNNESIGDRKSFASTESKAAKDTEPLITGRRPMESVPSTSGRSRLSKMDQQDSTGDSKTLLEASKKALHTDKYSELINTLDKYGITVESRYALNDNIVYLKSLLFGNYIFIEMDTAYTDLKSVSKDFSIVKDSHVIHTQPADSISAEQCSKLNGCGVVYECREGLCISNRDMSTFDTVEDRFRITTSGQRSEAFEKDGAPAYPIIKLSQLIVNPQLALNNLEYQRVVLHANAITKYQANMKIFAKTINNFTEVAKDTERLSQSALFNTERLLVQLNNSRNGASFPPEPQDKEAYQRTIYNVKGANDLFENLIIGSKYLDEVVNELNSLYERLQEYNTDLKQHYTENK